MRKSFCKDMTRYDFKEYVKNSLSYEGYTNDNEILVRAVELMEEKQGLAKEIKDRIQYFYHQMDGNYCFPNSVEGDILKLVKDYFKEE